MAFQSSIRISLLGLLVAAVGSAGASSTSSALMAYVDTQFRPKEAKEAKEVGPACKCSDVPSMKDRIAEAQAAIDAYRTAMAGMSREQEFSESGHTTVRASVQKAIDAYRRAHPQFRSYPAETYTSCEIQIDPGATPCLREALQTHESVHAKSCQDKKRWYDFLIWKLDWKQKMTLRDVQQEEIDGYQAEIDYLNKTLKSAQQDCPVALSRYETNDQRLAQRERVRRSIRRVSAYAAAI